MYQLGMVFELKYQVGNSIQDCILLHHLNPNLMASVWQLISSNSNQLHIYLRPTTTKLIHNMIPVCNTCRRLNLVDNTTLFGKYHQFQYQQVLEQCSFLCSSILHCMGQQVQIIPQSGSKSLDHSQHRLFDPCMADRYQPGIDTMYQKLFPLGINFLLGKESIYKLSNLQDNNSLQGIKGRKIDMALADKYQLDILLLKCFQSNNTRQLYNSQLQVLERQILEGRRIQLRKFQKVLSTLHQHSTYLQYMVCIK